MRAARAAAVSALLASLLAAGGCFKPNIQPGAYFCTTEGACPNNFTCVTSFNPPRCYPLNYHFDAGAPDGSAGGPGGAGGMGTGGAPGTGGTGAVDAACLGPVAPCTPSDAGMCDPVCNTRCGQCYEKCSVDSVGDLTCNTPYTASNPVGILAGVCQTQQTTSDPSTHTDNCKPGSACIAPNACGARCYQFCRRDTDCQTTGGGSTCSIDAGAGQKFCDVPTAQCDPVNGAAGVSPQFSGCPLAVQGCYMSGDTGNLVCDCYNLPGARMGDQCTHSRDCFPGLVCTDPTSVSGKHCYKVCRLPSPDGGVDLTRRDAGETGCNDYHNCMPLLLPSGAQRSLYGICNE